MDIKLIGIAAKEFSLSPNLVYAVCMVESAGQPTAARYEPAYKWFFDPKLMKPKECSLITEVTFQKTSWGLMQVMGAVYREYGYRGWLTAIIADVEAQLHYGCKHLAGKIKKFGLKEGVLAYNAGTPRKDQAGNYANIDYWIKVSREVDKCPL